MSSDLNLHPLTALVAGAITAIERDERDVALDRLERALSYLEAGDVSAAALRNAWLRTVDVFAEAFTERDAGVELAAMLYVSANDHAAAAEQYEPAE